MKLLVIGLSGLSYLALAGALHAQVQIKNPKLSGAGNLRAAATLTVEDTAEIIIESGGALTLEAGAVLTLSDPISLANGGTGAALTDPGADRIAFWDDSADGVTWLTVGSGLSISSTTLASAFVNPMTTAGDIIIGGVSGAATRLAAGTDGHVLTLDGGVPVWAEATGGGGGGGAPTGATYITQTSNGTLSNEQALASLSTGLLKVTTTTGVLSTAVSGTDYIAPGAAFTSGLTMNTDRILGRTTASAGAVEEITVGSGLTLAAGTLTATASAPSGALTASGYTMATSRLIGRTTASTGAPEEITVGTGLSLSSGTLSATGGGADEDDYYAVMVTMLRPSKIKWEVGSFGTFTPGGRIYARTLNLCRLGASGTNYVSNLHGTEPMGSFLPIEAGASVTATGAFSTISYVEEADVAAVTNARATYWRMMAFLARTSTVVHAQATATGAKSGSSITSITPGAYGSMILTLEGQGYEGDVVATISSTDYVAHVLAPKGALSTSTASNDWVHQWWGWQHTLLPIATTMDSLTISWGLRVYTGNTGYDGYINARIVDLPSWWATDAP